MLFLASCVAQPKLPQRSVEEVQLSAESYISKKMYTEAAAELAAAIALAPQNADHVLRHGEILETLSRWQDAQAGYKAALTILTANHNRRADIVYRLALLQLFKLDAPQAIDELISQLPVNTPGYHDIQGILAIRAGAPREALAHFNRGLAAQPTKEVAARILQHATVAYVNLNQVQQAFGTLYKAINLAEDKPALVQDIEADWNALKAEYGEY